MGEREEALKLARDEVAWERRPGSHFDLVARALLALVARALLALEAERDHWKQEADGLASEQRVAEEAVARAEKAEAERDALREALQEARDYIAEEPDNPADTADFHGSLMNKLDRALASTQDAG